MAKAQSVETPLEREVSRGGDAMMMLISRSVWDVLGLQAVAEGCEPGDVLSKAVSDYIERHGSDEVREYMVKLKEEARRGP